MWSSSASRSNRCDTSDSVPRLPAQSSSERYSALMKHTKHIYLLLASVLVASSAFAQTSNRQAASTAPAEDAIAAARSQYTPSAALSTDASDGETLAQFSRRRPGTPFPPQHGYRWGSGQTSWMNHGSPGHILIGAAIGFGVGAALGAHQSVRNGTPVSGGIIIGGGLFGFLGGCVGQAVATFPGLHYSSAHRRRDYQPSWPEEDEEGNIRSSSKTEEGRPGASAKSTSPGQPAGVEAMSPPSPGKAGIDD